MDKDFDQQQGLEVIQQMIATAKRNVSDNGFFYLLWGYAVLIASLSQYYMLKYTDTELHFLPWPILMTVAGITAGVAGARYNKRVKVKTYFDTLMGYLWGAFGISLFLVLLFMPKLGYEKTYPVIMILYGIGTFVSGGMLKFAPLVIGGIICWVAAAITHFLSPTMEVQLLILALVITCAYIIPGHMLKSKA